MSRIRYLPITVTLSGKEIEGARIRAGMDTRMFSMLSATTYPGLVDVDCYPELDPFCVDKEGWKE